MMQIHKKKTSWYAGEKIKSWERKKLLQVPVTCDAVTLFRSVFRTPSSNRDRAFHKNSKRLKAIRVLKMPLLFQHWEKTTLVASTLMQDSWWYY